VSCTRPCARPVHGRVHVPFTGPCTAMYPAEDVRTDGPYTVMYTGGVRAVYTARPLYGRVLAVFAGEDVFTGRVHGRRVTGTRHVTRRVYDTLHGRVHGPNAAAQRPSTRPWTVRTLTCNCRVDFLCTPYAWRCNVCVHVTPAHGPCTRTWTGRVDGPCIRLHT